MDRTEAPYLLEATGVEKYFAGVPALLDGRLQLQAGQVHALLGGNGAGKSTFLNILMGIHKPDAGAVTVRGRPVTYAKPSEALSDGIAIITQELSLLPDMTVAENIHLGIEPRVGRYFVDRNKLIRNATKLLEALRFEVDPKTPVRKLSVAKQQLVEIAKAINRRSDILIMDEPTSAIGDRETETLFDAIRELRSRGIGIIYVSHRLTDIFAIADYYTIFRDGRFVESGPVSEIDRAKLIQLIVGRTLADIRRTRQSAVGLPFFQARAFGREGRFDRISVSINEGETLGVFGLMGAGRSKFANALYGNAPKNTGEVLLHGRLAKIDSPRHAIANGIALVTEDRKETGLVLSSSVRDNISLPALSSLSRLGFVKTKAEKDIVDRMMHRFHVKAQSCHMLVRHLSGGNQQKVVFAKCLTTSPQLLICDEPTRGIDEGAKREVYRFLAEFAAQGNGILFISSDIPELLANTDRIVVFRSGRLVAEVPSQSATQEQLLHLAS
jgi:putative xylitol transport system ATP-binding protein